MNYSRLLILVALCLSNNIVQAGPVKCMGSDGRTTYTQGRCPPGTTEVGSYRPPPAKKSLGVACTMDKDEAACEKLRQMRKDNPEVVDQAFDDVANEHQRRLSKKCMDGDPKACAEVKCFMADRPSGTRQDMVECAKAKNLEYGNTWAQISPWITLSRTPRTTIVCLEKRTVFRDIKKFPRASIQRVAESNAFHNAGAYVYKRDWYDPSQPSSGKEDYDSLRSAAEAACSR